MVGTVISGKQDKEILPGQLAGFQQFLCDRGYPVSDDFLPDFFHAYNSPDICGMQMEDLEPVLRPMLVKEPWQAQDFHQAFRDFLRFDGKIVVSGKEEYKFRQQVAGRAAAQSRLESLNEELEESKKKINRLQEKIEKEREEGKDKKKEEKAAKEFAKVKTSYTRLVEKHAEGKTKKQLLELAQTGEFPGDSNDRQKANEAMKEMLKGAIACKDFKAVMAFIKKQASTLKSTDRKRSTDEEKLEEARQEIEQKQKAKEQTQARIDQLIQEFNDGLAVVRKNGAGQHREVFDIGKKAVQSDAPGDTGMLSKSFRKLTGEDKQDIQAYIRENTRDFRTRLTRNINATQKHRFDMANTCRKACATDGVPMRLCFTRPARQQAKLVMFLDISGSCKEASELMLYFMYYMREAFPGGCKTYVFVNSLYDISSVFEAQEPEAAVQAVLETIPTRGVYSDYNAPFADFHKNHMSEITYETMVFFIGDARNNKNPTGEEYVKDISRRAKRAFWLNTEKRAEWDKADSIISIYGKYMDRIGEVLTPQGLINFLVGIK